MIFGIDANVLTRSQITGTERYVLELLNEMKKEPLTKGERVILYSSSPLCVLDPLPAQWENKVLNWPPRKCWTHARLSWELLKRTPNLFFTPAHEIPAFYKRTKIVSTIHDIAFRYFPQVYSKPNIARQELSVKRALRESCKIISISDSTKSDLVKCYHANPEKIEVIHLGVRKEAFLSNQDELSRVMSKYQLKTGGYFISVGRIEKKKNIPMLINAFLEYCIDNPDGKTLVLAGGFGEGKEDILHQIENSPLKEKIRILGYVPDTDLVPLLRGSAAYLFPSLYEGFGLPALEAMACGTPLVASSIPALCEVAGRAAIFAEPQNTYAWAKLMHDVTSESFDRNAQIENQYARLDEFSWEKTAKKTWGVLRAAVYG